MTVELKNRLQLLIEKQLPDTVVFDYPNVNMITQYIEKILGFKQKQIEDQTKLKLTDSMSTKDLWEIAEKEISRKGWDYG